MSQGDPEQPSQFLTSCFAFIRFTFDDLFLDRLQISTPRSWSRRSQKMLLLLPFLKLLPIVFSWWYDWGMETLQSAIEEATQRAAFIVGNRPIVFSCLLMPDMPGVYIVAEWDVGRIDRELYAAELKKLHPIRRHKKVVTAAEVLSMKAVRLWHQTR